MFSEIDEPFLRKAVFIGDLVYLQISDHRMY